MCIKDTIRNINIEDLTYFFWNRRRPNKPIVNAKDWGDRFFQFIKLSTPIFAIILTKLKYPKQKSKTNEIENEKSNLFFWWILFDSNMKDRKGIRYICIDLKAKSIVLISTPNIFIEKYTM